MRKIIIIISVMLASLSTKAQTAQLDSLVDDMFFSESSIDLMLTPKKKFHFVYLRSALDTRTHYAGREIGDQQYNVSGQIYYFAPNGIFAGASGSWYSQSDPGYTSTTARIGFGQSIKSLPGLRYRLSYDHFFYTSDEYASSYTGSANLGLRYQYRWAGVSADASVLIGDEYSTQFYTSLYAKFDLLKWGKLNRITLRPSINLQIGSEAVEYERTSYIRQTPITEYYTVDETGLLNTQVRVPVSVNLGNFDLELGYVLNLPHSLDNNYVYDPISYFSFSVGYIFGFRH